MASKDQPKGDQKPEQGKQEGTTLPAPAAQSQKEAARPGRMEKSERAKHYKQFIIEETFPDPFAVFSFVPKGVSELIDSAHVFLDANVLSAPYQASQEDLSELEKMYGKLIEQKRLVIPVQAAREFARHRLDKVRELIESWDKSRNSNLQVDGASSPTILGAMEEFKAAKKLEKELRAKIDEYRKAMDRVREKISNWCMDDPISAMYRKLFTPSVFAETKKDRNAILEDARHRLIHEIPPGYMDGDKVDEGIGDLVIWQTILDECAKRKSDAIFVTNELKKDWTHTTADNKQQLFARAELIEEFRRETGGRSFVLLSFSRFLQAMKASPSFVERMEEVKLKLMVATHPERDVWKASQPSGFMSWYESREMEKYNKVFNRWSMSDFQGNLYLLHGNLPLSELEALVKEFLALKGIDDKSRISALRWSANRQVICSILDIGLATP